MFVKVSKNDVLRLNFEHLHEQTYIIMLQHQLRRTLFRIVAGVCVQMLNHPFPHGPVLLLTFLIPPRCLKPFGGGSS